MEFPISGTSDDIYVVVVHEFSGDSNIEVINFDEHDAKEANIIAANVGKLVHQTDENPIEEAIPTQNPLEIDQIDEFYEYDHESYEHFGDLNSQLKLPDFSELLQKYNSSDKDLVESYVITMNECAKVGLPRLPERMFKSSGDEFICLFCQHLSKSEHGAIKHYRYIHGPVHHKCLACGSSFKRFTSLCAHEDRCKKPNARLVRAARKIYNQIKPNRNTYRKIRIPCRICNKMISRKNMKQHIAVHAGIKKFKCKWCTAEFRTWRAKKAHMNAHIGKRPYQCDQCPNAYTSDTALRAHKHNHYEREFICEVCSSAFKRKDSLKSHSKIHAEAEAHLCPDCGKVLTGWSAYDRHLKMHAGDQDRYNCIDCDKSYSSIYALNIHMKQRHGKKVITRKMFYDKLPKMPMLCVNNSEMPDESMGYDDVLAQ